ncbi:MAG TPA: cupin domain-containing protein [bacterium]|jgi:predicted cupin superfamily sugar epimerase|nr:cupin domain-containing protein [bacterium]
MTVDQIIQSLDLKPHPEGGYYRETYRGPSSIPGFKPPRFFSTAIYYLLTPDSVSKMHRLASDEMFHFYLGDPVTWVLLRPEGDAQKMVLGQGLERGQQVQLVIPAGTWFGGYLNEGGSFALMGTTVAPGFEFNDFVLGGREKLLALFPRAAEEIRRLT